MQHVSSIIRDYPYKMADPFEDILMANERFLLCTICSSLAHEADLKHWNNANMNAVRCRLPLGN